MRTKVIALTVLTITAGVFALTRTNGPSSGLRDAVADRDFDVSIPVADKNSLAVPVPEAAAPVPAARGSVYVREYTYQASEDDNKKTAKNAALTALKRELLEELGVYVESETVVKDNALVSDNIVSKTGGIVATKTISEKWDGKVFYLKARLTVDMDALKQFKNKDGVEAAATAPVKGNDVKWIAIPGGKFAMGTDDFIGNVSPVHEVALEPFIISKTAVTVGQYAECVAKGKCTAPDTVTGCNWGKEGRELHPVNCVDWFQADQYAKFKNARLPSEAEWEYAAKSGGRSWKYPWGNETPTCERAVMDENGGFGCGKSGTWPVCSKPAGNTAQGLCDMAGNVAQWTQDIYELGQFNWIPDKNILEKVDSYVIRGGSIYDKHIGQLRTDYRYGHRSRFRVSYVGFRIARSGY